MTDMTYQRANVGRKSRAVYLWVWPPDCDLEGTSRCPKSDRIGQFAGKKRGAENGPVTTIVRNVIEEIQREWGSLLPPAKEPHERGLV